jgi:hypothetical protein
MPIRDSLSLCCITPSYVSWIRKYFGQIIQSEVERAPRTDWIGGWVDPRAGLDVRRQISAPAVNRTPVHPVALSLWAYWLSYTVSRHCNNIWFFDVNMTIKVTIIFQITLNFILFMIYLITLSVVKESLVFNFYFDSLRNMTCVIEWSTKDHSIRNPKKKI